MNEVSTIIKTFPHSGRLEELARNLETERDALREQVAFLERFADAPGMETGKTTRDLLREREKELVATLLDIARDCEAIAEDERDAGYKGTFASIASQARGVLAKARP